MQRSTASLDLPSLILIAALALVGATIAFVGQQLVLIGALLGVGALILIWKHPHFGILILLSTFLFRYPSYLQGYGFLTINNIIGAVLCLLLFFHLLEKRDLWALHDSRIRIIMAISAVFLISTWLAREPPQNMAKLDRTSIELWDFFTQSAFVIFMIHFIRTREQLTFVFALFFFAIMVSAISALLITGVDYRASASFGIDAATNSNRLGFYSLAGIVILWYLRQSVSTPMPRVALLGVAALLLLVVFLTSSRSALINTLVFAGILAVEAGVRPRRLIGTFIVIGVVSFLVLKLVPEQNLERITAFDTSSGVQSEAHGSATHRLRVAQVALEIYSDSNLLVGVGPGNFRWIRQLDYDLERLSLHNGYLWALLSGGLAGLVLYLALYWTCWRDLRWLEAQPGSPSSPPSWMIKSTRTLLLLFLVFSLFAEVWLEIIPFFIIGLTIVMLRLHSQAVGRKAS